MSDVLKIRLISDKAKVPYKAYKKSAGFDLYSAENVTIKPHQRQLILTDIAVELPRQTYGRIAARSGLSYFSSIDVGAGVIDEDFQGNIGVLLINNGNKPFQVNVHDRIAQLIVEKICHPKLQIIEGLPQVIRQEKKTEERGKKGFGSTGVNNTPNKTNKQLREFCHYQTTSGSNKKSNANKNSYKRD